MNINQATTAADAEKIDAIEVQERLAWPSAVPGHCDTWLMVNAGDLSFKASEQYPVSAMANIGYQLLQEIAAYRPGFEWKATPTEIVGALIEEMHLKLPHPAQSLSTPQAAVGERDLSDIAEYQFLSDVITSAGLLTHGKRDKGLARRIGDYAFAKMCSTQAPPVAVPIEWISERAGETLKIARDSAKVPHNHSAHIYAAQRPDSPAGEACTVPLFAVLSAQGDVKGAKDAEIVDFLDRCGTVNFDVDSCTIRFAVRDNVDGGTLRAIVMAAIATMEAAS